MNGVVRCGKYFDLEEVCADRYSRFMRASSAQ